MTSQQINSVTSPQVQQKQPARSPQLQQLIEIGGVPNLQVEVRDHSIGIVVPTTVEANIATDTSPQAEQTKQFMVELFGGVSWFEQEGLYISPDWGMIREKSIVVRSYATTETLHRHFPALLRFVGNLQRQLRQETMAVIIDGQMLLLQFL